MTALSEDPLFLDDACVLGDGSCSLELLQLRAASKLVAQDCPERQLVGKWADEDALGFKTITVKLDVQAPADSASCDFVNADLIMPSYLGPPMHYQVTMMPTEDGKYKVKYYNALANLPYSHEGEFDPKTQLLTEDLGHPMPGGTETVLKFFKSSE
eukprot:CAMPEP_0183455832 /NCGR_PEP_ID=MMETSP0370-20130417/127523_1 /TAXON_ID=268820 /ORGANISM="Peridinium aciculiferum, Strain PAER-2" /LENGTH=155 /DNA_ID=CAMNT_0025647443 /DNA_START=32 /DNA_END=499 /DNA_ORIENTATION=-